MINAADFINNLATNAGIAADNSDLKTLLSDARLSAINIPDAVVGGIQSAHLTIESAKANPDLIKYFRATNLDPLDKTVFSTLTELGIDEAELADLKSEKSTYNKVALAIKKVSSLKEAAAKANAEGSTGKAAEYEKQVLALNAQISQIKDAFNTEKSELVKSYDNKYKSRILNEILLGYEYASEQPKEVQLELANILLNKHLSQNKWETRLDNDNISLVTSEGTKVFDNNKEVTIKALADKIVSENKLIKVNAPPTPGKTPQTAQGQFTPPAQGSGTSVFDTHLATTLQQFQTA
jgi:hypothetical protein